MRIYKNNFAWFVLFFGIVAVFVYFTKDKIEKTKIPPFTIQKVEFDGNDHVADILLLKASGLRYKSNIFSYSMEDVKRRLENIAWVRSVIVQRRLPDHIYVRIAERVPIAILQMHRKLYLVDSDGEVLEHDGIGSFENLPIVIGEGAGKETPHFIEELEKFPKIRKQLVFAIWIGNRRWNMKLSHGLLVKLPERNLFHALSILDEISDSNGFFNSDIEIIDLRLLDRVVVTKRKESK